jgi:hypothetical protein
MGLTVLALYFYNAAIVFSTIIYVLVGLFLYIKKIIIKEAI